MKQKAGRAGSFEAGFGKMEDLILIADTFVVL